MFAQSMKIAIAIAENQNVKSVQNGLISIMPIMLVGAFVVLLLNMPIPYYSEFMAWVFGSDWRQIALHIHRGTLSIMSLAALVSISYSMAANRVINKGHNVNGIVNPIIASIISLGCLFTIIHAPDNTLSFDVLGNLGLFVAIITALVSHHLFFFFWDFRPLRIKLSADTLDTQMIQAISSIQPAFFTLAVFGVTSFAFYRLAGIYDIHASVYNTLQNIFLGNESSLSMAIFFSLATHILWFFGLHGNNMLDHVAQSLWVPQQAANLVAVQAGEIPTGIFAKEFFDVFVFMGGSGATLSLIFAFFLVARKRSNSLKLAKYSLPLGLVNINETLVYGLPIVLNPFFLVPFILVPIVFILTSYIAMVTGLVPLVINTVSWTEPPILGGFAATGSVRGSILQVINLSIGTLIYIPFVKMSARYKGEKNRQVFRRLVNESEEGYVEFSQRLRLLSRTDEVGLLARALLEDMKNNLKEKTGIFLEYQPQVDTNGKIVGCEALVRWNHEFFGRIPPPVILSIAEEGSNDFALNEHIFDTAISTLKSLHGQGFAELSMSVNISPRQLHHPGLLGMIESTLERYEMEPKYIKVELTENSALGSCPETQNIFRELTRIGIPLAIDDFGMGHASLLYLREFEVQTIKLDGSLTKDVLENNINAEIISAVSNLCKNMNIEIVAEFVETSEQCDKLKELGCDTIQGYYYSRPLADKDLIKFLRDFKA